MKKEFKDLHDKAISIENELVTTIAEKTAKKPLRLFKNPEEKMMDGTIYDYPYGYWVDKHDCYNEGRIMSVQGEKVTLYMTGEGFTDNMFKTTLWSIPFDSLIDLLKYL